MSPRSSSPRTLFSSRSGGNASWGPVGSGIDITKRIPQRERSQILPHFCLCRAVGTRPARAHSRVQLPGRPYPAQPGRSRLEHGARQRGERFSRHSTAEMRSLKVRTGAAPLGSRTLRGRADGSGGRGEAALPEPEAPRSTSACSFTPTSLPSPVVVPPPSCRRETHLASLFVLVGEKNYQASESAVPCRWK